MVIELIMLNNDRTTLFKTIEILRFPMAVAVVFIHSFGPGIDSAINSISCLTNISTINGIDLYNLIRILFSKILTYIAVPCFFFISGYLFFLSCKEFNRNIYFSKIRKRFKTLIIPYLFWNLAMLVYIVIIKLCAKDYAYITDLFSSLNPLSFFWSSEFDTMGSSTIYGYHYVKSYPFNGPLWFVRDLIVQVLLTPVTFFLIHKLKKGYILLLLAVYLLNLWPYVPGVSIEAIFFFSSGAYLAINGIDVLNSPLFQNKHLSGIVSIIACALALFYFKAASSDFFLKIYSITGIIALFNIGNHIIVRNKGKLLLRLSETSFFIFATHLFIFKPIKIYDHFIDSSSVPLKIFHFFLNPVLTILLCILAYYLLKKIAPSILNFATGSRSNRQN